MSVSILSSSASGLGLLAKLRYVEHIELFRDIPLSSLRFFLLRCQEMQYFPNDIILTPHQSNDKLFLILVGQVTIHLNDLSADPVATLGPGDCFGEISAFDGIMPSAYVKASTHFTCLSIERDTLWQMINFSHGIARNMLALLSRRLRVNNQTISLVQRERDEHFSAAHQDALTAVFNRRWLDVTMQQLDHCIGKDDLPLSILVLDVDHFKRINDEFGHDTGDQTLRELASVLGAELRPQDKIARYGGEEFVVLLPRTSAVGAMRVAERLRGVIERSLRVPSQAAVRSVTVSCGVAQWSEGELMASLFSRADKALYEAKAAGRNCVVLAQPPEPERA